MKRGLNSTESFRIVRYQPPATEWLYDILERDMDAALAISPCSAIRVKSCGVTLCGQLGPSHDPRVPPIEIRF